MNSIIIIGEQPHTLGVIKWIPHREAGLIIPVTHFGVVDTHVIWRIVWLLAHELYYSGWWWKWQN